MAARHLLENPPDREEEGEKSGAYKDGWMYN